MNNRNGELNKKAELLEIKFLEELGVDTLGRYTEVENHISEMIDVLVGENDDLQDVSECDMAGLEQDLEDKCNAISSAGHSLRNMKKVVDKMRNSDLKTTLISYIEDMEIDLS